MRYRESLVGAVLIALLLIPWNVVADEIDITGSWQVNLDCSAYGTATSAMLFSEDVTTGVVTAPAQTNPCGTVALTGEAIAVLENCVNTPDPAIGQVTGSSFAIPTTGYVFTDQAVEDPLYWNLFGCTIDQILVENRWDGTIEDDGFGTATRITGALTNGSVNLVGCLSVPGPISFCNFEMLRSEVPAGSNVTVSPSPDVSVTFATVSAPGTASVTELNDPDGEIPVSFQLLGGVLPIFYDVATTASISGTISTCVDYADANNDGTVDGTTIDETDLQLLHEEDQIFVDRTSGIDTVNNVICADTTSLSQLVPGAPGDPGGPGPGPGPSGDNVDVPVSGVKILVKRKTSGQEKVAYVSRDKFTIFRPVLGSDDDPTQVGATFEVISAAEGLDTFDLPASGWFTTNSGVLKFKGALVPGGSIVKKAVIKEGKAIVVKMTETALPLTGPHTAMAVRLTTGDIRHCSRFGPKTVVKDEADRFRAKGAKAGALFDCSNAALGIASPSGAFLDPLR